MPLSLFCYVYYIIHVIDELHCSGVMGDTRGGYDIDAEASIPPRASPITTLQCSLSGLYYSVLQVAQLWSNYPNWQLEDGF